MKRQQRRGSNHRWGVYQSPLSEPLNEIVTGTESEPSNQIVPVIMSEHVFRGEEIRIPLTDVVVKLIGENGNAHAIMGRVSEELRRAGHGDLVDEYVEEATSGDYNHLLLTTSRYVVIE